MAERHGSLSINSENIFPIIKKWLYSDHDIFYRELISNGCDAITKRKKLDVMGESHLPEDYKPQIQVIVNTEEKTLKVIDNGLGMTADEVEEYINQIAFSGAADFIEKYKDKSDDNQIIGHFGLGFYSAFMVADEVHIDTLSYKEGAVPVHWECDGGTEFSMTDGTWDQVGTQITLFLNEDCLQFCNEYKAEEVIQKYCSFMPVEIWLSRENTPETQTINEDEKVDTDVVLETIQPEKKEKKEENKDGEEGEKEEEKPEPVRLKIKKRPVLMNDIHPLWTKNPSECQKDDYIEFYRKVFHDYKEPLFWIHLNMDYPFNLKGILYFPKINMEYESIEGVIKLYNNQVFIADNIKEVIPEFLMLLKGVIDCPDLPLNVSRSALQNDGFVKKSSDYITKKVADKLSGLCKTSREEYKKYWDDISPFVKYGCLKDDKFCQKMTDYILFKDLDGNYKTLPDCLEVGKSDPDEKGEAAVDENGEMVDGDQIMGIVGVHMRDQGKLKKDTIVATVMSNLGFFKMGEREHLNMEQTKVGDRYVLERMREIGASLGGEQSGHIIFLDENTTGDGLLSALHLLQVMVDTKKPLSELAKVMTVMPQALINAKVPNHKKDRYMEYPEISGAIEELDRKFAGEGRVLIRPSGTEPKVRVMIEGKDQKMIEEEARKLADLIQNIML